MILNIEVDPKVAEIYAAEAEKHGGTMLDLMASVLAFWPAIQWQYVDDIELIRLLNARRRVQLEVLP